MSFGANLFGLWIIYMSILIKKRTYYLLPFFGTD